MEKSFDQDSLWAKVRPYLYVLPVMLAILVFVVYPVIDLVIRSFQQWNMVSTPKWVGIKNYTYNFNKREFVDAIKHTCTYAFWVELIGLSLSTLFALWLSKNTFLNNLTRTFMFLPYVISLLSVAMVWTWIMNKNNGLLNMVLGIFSLPPLKWIDSSDTAMMSIIIVTIWKSTGYCTMLIYAALQNVPTELYEAADLDNANKLTKFFRITFPLISPQMFMLLITTTIGSFKVFETIRVMTKGGPGSSTQVLVYYIYKMAFVLNKVGYAASGGVVLMGIIGVMTIIYFSVLSKRVYYQ